MYLNRNYLLILALLALPISVSADAITYPYLETFQTDIVRSPTQAPGAWYVDRYAPAVFEGGVEFDGDHRLRHGINAADGANNRPPFFEGVFFNTQGRKFDTPEAITVSIDLYVPLTWETSNRRMAGFWTTALDANGSISGFPIIEFTSDQNNARFRFFSRFFGWVDLGLPTGFGYDQWYTLQIELFDNEWTATVGDLVYQEDALGSVQVENVILQGYNTQEGVTYDIYWDNFRAIPEPVSLMVLAVGSMLMLRRKLKG